MNLMKKPIPVSVWRNARHRSKCAISYFDDILRYKILTGSNDFITDNMNTTACQPNGMLSHLSTDKCVHNIIDEVLFYAILLEKMLHEYNFIGVQERMLGS